jgi:hypothetical protein
VTIAKGKLLGKPPKLSGPQQRPLMELPPGGPTHDRRAAELFNVGRAAVYRIVRRQEGLMSPRYGH